jgi:aspartate racemase
MEEDFYKGKLVRDHGLNVVTPSDADMDIIHGLVKQGAEGVIFGCTEIDLLIKNDDSQIPVFDSTLIHAQAAVDYALEK